ncbi:efflux RND transporter periplasmic adaptor subunit [Blastochloris viridis]|uniref:Efflux pump periplasmic linker BepF n=1 Tax=Blastochloris viridis TaxID=1079 RepID=A0A0H5BNN6_BLAVI|nr:efflux RND transporter periplasmic adaptor subunit [Blastochloris viridis]ALK08737.1 Efflux pump periplasmic linker BepF [Blastochloris viridis]BAR97968.1 RND efflux membrane fusion protein [Blastochloris viridis]CUU41398.1 Efflux pump periplasmic linker BepF [Blastochloris viridis]
MLATLASPRSGPWLVLALSLAVAACTDGKAKHAADEPRTVRVETVRLTALASSLTLTGTVRARYEIPMAFRVGGKIAARLVDPGARVKAGQTLARLEADDYRLALRAAEADVRSAEAETERATAQESRTRELTAKGHSSQAANDQAVSTARAARERLDAAKSQREIAANKLAYTELVAEADGVVMSVAAEPGQVVAEGRAVLTLATGEAREAVVAVPESRLPALGSGEAKVTFWAMPGRTVTAKLRELSPEADAVTRTFLARFILDGASDLPLGITAQVTLAPKAIAEVAQIPATAVWWRGDQAMVWVADDAASRLIERRVDIVRLGSERAAVRGELNDGDKVVVLGVHRLDATMPIRLSELH